MYNVPCRITVGNGVTVVVVGAGDIDGAGVPVYIKISVLHYSSKDLFMHVNRA